jgi:hypothetical protein
LPFSPIYDGPLNTIDTLRTPLNDIDVLPSPRTTDPRTHNQSASLSPGEQLQDEVEGDQAIETTQ